MESGPLRILVVDDTATYRKIVGDVLSQIPGVEVVGTASDGKMALERIARLDPDLLILDIEMPEMDGLEVLDRIEKDGLETGAIVLSALADDQRVTIRALEQGAFDFVAKPRHGTVAENEQALKETLAAKLRAFARHRDIRRLLKKGQLRPPAAPIRPPTAPVQRSSGPGPGTREVVAIDVSRPKSAVVAIGISTGGPAALARMLPALPAGLDAALLIVQHMPATFTAALADSLNAKCSFRVKEAEDGESIRPGVAYIAPGDRQMKVASASLYGRRIIRLTDDPPENSCRPSADYLFRSVARCYGKRATGVIMTGMGADGALGLRAMKEKGAFIIAQDKSTCVVYGMPREVIEAGIADVVAPLEEIAAEIRKTLGSGR